MIKMEYMGYFMPLKDGIDMALNAFLNKVKNGKTVNVAYLGGSITEGAGSSKDEFTWRRKTSEYLRRRFPNAVVNEIAAGIGGTGSSLGLFRLRHDVLNYAPDLLFVEFAVNDCNAPFEQTRAYMEGIVRLTLKEYPDCGIVFIYTTQGGMYREKKQGIRNVSYLAHDAVAMQYGIETIDVGKTIEDAADAHDGDFRVCTIDGCHPNDEGYALYAKRIEERMEEIFAAEGDVHLAAPITDEYFDDADIIDPYDCLLCGFEKVEGGFYGRMPHIVKAAGNGETLSFEFDGECLGIYLSYAKDSGDISWVLDGKDMGSVRTFDKYCLEFDRSNYNIIGFKLEKGHHKVTLTACGTKDERSVGTVVRIAGLLVARRG